MKSFFFVALLILLTFTGRPVAAEDACTDMSDLTLLYRPDEPPPCQVTGGPPIVSNIGRPTDYRAIELAACAGLMDAILQVHPQAFDEPEFVRGSIYFQLAESIRERPPLWELAEWRERWRNDFFPNLEKYVSSGSTEFIHAMVGCKADFRRATAYICDIESLSMPNANAGCPN